MLESMEVLIIDLVNLTVMTEM